MEFAKEVWGNRFQAVVTTHLNTKHLHCHYVINSVSFVDGKRLWGDEKAWFKFRLVADKICEKYGLYYNPNPNRSKQSSYYYKQEQAGMPTRYSMTRQAIDEAIAHSTNLKSLDYALTQMGYEHCLSECRKYWTIVPKGYKKPITASARARMRAYSRVVLPLPEVPRTSFSISVSSRSLIFAFIVTRKRR